MKKKCSAYKKYPRINEKLNTFSKLFEEKNYTDSRYKTLKIKLNFDFNSSLFFIFTAVEINTRYCKNRLKLTIYGWV